MSGVCLGANVKLPDGLLQSISLAGLQSGEQHGDREIEVQVKAGVQDEIVWTFRVRVDHLFAETSRASGPL